MVSLRVAGNQISPEVEGIKTPFRGFVIVGVCGNQISPEVEGIKTPG